ncbi:MAG: hypothetical protein QQN63_00020 [Nitrosopumilus sp.]
MFKDNPFEAKMEDPARNYEIKIEFVGLPTEIRALISSPSKFKRDFAKLCKELREHGFTKTTNARGRKDYQNLHYIPADKIKKVVLTTKS